MKICKKKKKNSTNPQNGVYNTCGNKSVKEKYRQKWSKLHFFFILKMDLFYGYVLIFFTIALS